MGGNAFLNARADGQPTLKTPRLIPEEYGRLKDIYTRRLSAYFSPENVKVLVEAPEKADYGDIDIQIIQNAHIEWAEVASAVGATAWLDRGSNKSQKCSLAVRLDGEKSTHAPVKYVPVSRSDASEQKSEQVYAQIDLGKIAPELKDWAVFFGSYGDLAGMLGNVVTNFGFDITDRGLRLRLQELDDSGQGEWKHFKLALDQGRMMLSSDPVTVLEFFGLSVEHYDSGFQSEDEIFEWLVQCRMISEHSLKRERKQAARDKQKADRSMFLRFFNDWLPSQLEEAKPDTSAREGNTATNEPLTLSQLRTKYLSEALNFFHKDSHYASLRAALLRKRANETAAVQLRALLAAHSGEQDAKLTELVRAFRRNVAYLNPSGPVVLDHARTDAESWLYTFLDEGGMRLRDWERVDVWVGENFERVKGVERGNRGTRKGHRGD
jgi:hypothetical protein